ncbi:MAG: glutamine--fructose-6-phosphate transaminase (isomerizing) [Clostridia bacterium]|nr:glutamine--fructose-6-phosphate transaminase (isomerizing) [Clostridia bacterium]
MCGIIGFSGKFPEKIIIENLKKLEYRGYDSAGIAVSVKDEIKVFKAKGEIKNLEKVVVPSKFSETGIGHTRWATHGKPDEINAHPHVSTDGEWAIVHNGIIENYSVLKEQLIKKGYSFYSETDTETIEKLLEYHYKGDALSALQKTCTALHGSYALCVLHKNDGKIYFAKSKSPLYVSKSLNSVMVASDVICFKGFSNNYFQIEDGVCGYVQNDEIAFYDGLGKIELKTHALELDNTDSGNAYKHFMLKEIYETKAAIKNILEHYSLADNRNKFKEIDFSKIKKIKLVGCGTAYHACMMGAKMFEDAIGLECIAHVASEFRYSDPKISSDTMVVFISQSGETADTLAAFEIAKNKGAVTVALVNVEYSTLAKSVDVCMPIKAGVEIAVASTKAYSAQLVVLQIVSEILKENLKIGTFSLQTVQKLYDSFDYGITNDYKLLADALRYNRQIFMIGRGADYCTALEASLKIKETSYINSDTYYAGELKHGFLALIEEGTYVVAFATDKKIFSKTISNAEEARARGAKVILFTCFDVEPALAENFYYIIKVKNIENPLQCVLNIVPWQIIAYYTSIYKGYNPDKPRNLAKSVTVE